MTSTQAHRHAGAAAVGRAALAGIALALGLASMGGQAEPRKPDASAQALRKAQGMLREMSESVKALQSEKAGLEDQVKTLTARVRELEGLPEQVRQQKASLESLNAHNEQLQSRLGNEARRIETLQGKQRATVALLGKVRQDNALLVQAVSERSQWIKTCGEKNGELISANQELLQKYQDKGFWSVLSAEPFTQVGAIQEENAAQEYRFKLEDLQVTPWRDPAATAAGETGAAGSEEAPDEDDGE